MTGETSLIHLDALRRINGTCAESIGQARSGAPIPVVSAGPTDAPTCVIVAGMHSSELTGVWAALEVAQRVTQLAEEIAVHIVPAVNLDGVQHNAELAGDAPELAALLRLHNHHDLEGEFCTGDHPEAEVLRNWLEGLPRVDAFVSLHAANHLAPGGFVYLGGDDEMVQDTARCFGERMDEHRLPRLAHDPTGVGGAALAAGVFGLPDAPGSCIDFAQSALDPALVAVTELPVGIVDVDGPIPLARLDEWKRRYAAGDPLPDVSVTDCVEEQLDVLTSFVADICKSLRRRQSMFGRQT